MNNIHSNRIAWIDIMKGILFCLVVSLHITQRSYIYTPPIFSDIINFFSPLRMPAYFFLSGLLFSNRKLRTYPQYIKSKTKTLLLPYVTFSILFLILDWNTYIIDNYYVSGFKKILGGMSSHRSEPLWFVFTLYSICICYYPFHRFMNRYKYFYLPFSVLFITISYYITHYNIHMYFNLGTTFSAIPFFIWGVSYKEFIFYITNLTRPKKIAFIFITFTVYSIILFTYNSGGQLYGNQINNYFTFYILAILGILGFCCICSELSKLKLKILGILENVSRNALVILATHMYILMIEDSLIKYYFYEANKYIIMVLSIATLVIAEIICIALANKYFYIFMGKKKLSFKESLSISRE